MDWEWQLKRAVEAYSVEEIKSLLNQDEARLLIERKEWVSWEGPLHFATRKGRNDIIKLLLEAGADINCQSGTLVK